MLVGIVADVYRAETGEFVMEMCYDTVADGLEESIEAALIHGDYDSDDLATASEIMEFLRGPRGHAVTWSVR